MEFSEHFLSPSRWTVLGSKQVEREASVGGGPKTGDWSAKSDAGKIGLEVVLGAGKEEGRQALDRVGHMADTCSTLLMGPHLTSSAWTHKAPSCQLLSFSAQGLSFSVGDALAIHGQPEELEKQLLCYPQLNTPSLLVPQVEQLRDICFTLAPGSLRWDEASSHSPW